MNRFLRILSMIMAVVMLGIAAPYVNAGAETAADGMVRVKLSRLGSPSKLVFNTTCAYYINNSTEDKIPGGSTVTVALEDGVFHLQAGSVECRLEGSFTLNRQKGGVSGVKFTTPAMANVYTGDLLFQKSSGKIVTIMTTYVEDYLYGVVGYEMSNSYPLEALKAQAMAARNYVMRAKATRSARDYDVTDTTADQVYKGYNASYANVIKAVDQTRGQLLYYKDSLAACYYAASNGGQTEATKNIWGSSLAYSVVKDDRYDLESGATSKSATIKKDQTGETLKKQLRDAIIEGISGTLEKHGCSTAQEDITIDEIVSIVPTTPKYAAPSRLYTELEFTVAVTSIDAGGNPVKGQTKAVVPTYGKFETWYKLSINSGDNEVVWVDETEDDITVTFRRWGHGVGMSQRGARVMAEDYSMGHDAILDFYYPGTKIRTLTLIDTTGSGLDGGVKPELPEGRARVKLENKSDKLKMRMEPDKNSDVLTKIEHGAVVDVYGVTGTWTKAGYGGYIGYVKSKYLTALDESTPAPAPTATPAPEPTPTPAPTREPDEDAEQYAKIKLSNKNSKLKVRKKAKTSSKVVRLIKHGKIVKILAEKGNWVKIETANGKKGFVMNKYLKRINGASGAEAFAADVMAATYDGGQDHIYAVLGEDGYLMESPETDAMSVIQTNSGDEVFVLACMGEWTYVAYGEMEGFVPTGSLRRVDQ